MRLHVVRVALVAALLATACASNDPVESAAPTTTEPAVESTLPSTDEAEADVDDFVADIEPTTDEASTSSGAPASTTTAADTTTSEAETIVAPTSTTTTSTTAAPETTTTAQPGELVDLVGGGQLDLNSIEGTDTVLWFWAPW